MRDRPRAMNELDALLTRRQPLYEMADAIVDTSDRPVGAVVDSVLLASRAADTIER
jgi:shikimate kinase